jgi:hypothetical protein
MVYLCRSQPVTLDIAKRRQDVRIDPMTGQMSDLQSVVENLAITDGLTVVLNRPPGNKLSVASRMWPDEKAQLGFQGADD